MDDNKHYINPYYDMSKEIDSTGDTEIKDPEMDVIFEALNRQGCTPASWTPNVQNAIKTILLYGPLFSRIHPKASAADIATFLASSGWASIFNATVRLTKRSIEEAYTEMYKNTSKNELDKLLLSFRV